MKYFVVDLIKFPYFLKAMKTFKTFDQNFVRKLHNHTELF